MLEPVTESLEVHWPPSVHYELNRLDLLADLKARDLVREFRVTSRQVGVRTDTAQVTTDAYGTSLSSRGSITSPDALILLRAAAGSAAPKKYHLKIAFQFLVGLLDKPYDAARRGAIDRLSLGILDASDFAMLIEGKRDSAEWHCEFGIVSRDEVRPRFNRWVGRFAEDEDSLPTFAQPPTNIAPVSFFADLMWLVPDKPWQEGDGIAGVARDVDRLRIEASRIVSAIHARVCEVSFQSITEGSEQ